jgi:hypothetical protein
MGSCKVFSADVTLNERLHEGGTWRELSIEVLPAEVVDID